MSRKLISFSLISFLIVFYSTTPNTPQLAAGMKAGVESYEAQTRNEVKFLSVVGLGIRLRRMNHPKFHLRYPVACYGEVHTPIGSGASADIIKEAHLEAQLVAEDESVRPGQPFLAGLHLKMTEGWHIYWINPGDSGLATRIDWQLPEGCLAGSTFWPFPQKFTEGELTTYGYTKEEFLLTYITVPKTFKEKNLVVKARVTWLACREICVPGKADVSLTLPVKNEEPKIDKKVEKLYLQTKKRWPAASILLEPSWQTIIYDADEFLALDVVSSDEKIADVGELTFFPEQNDLIDHGGGQRLERIEKGYRLWIPKSALFKQANAERIKGVLVCEKGWNKEGSRRAIEIDSPLLFKNKMK